MAYELTGTPLEIYNKLPQLGESLLEGKLEVANEVVEQVYSELVSAGLYECQDIFEYQDCDKLHATITDLTSVLNQSSRSDGSSVKTNYECYSQNVVTLMLTIKLLNDLSVSDKTKEDLASQFTIFSPFGLSIPFQCFPFKSKERREQIFSASAYREILPELKALALSGNPLISSWANSQLQDIKESVWRIRKEPESSFDTVLDIEITPEEQRFFALEIPDRKIFTFGQRLKSDFEKDPDLLKSHLPNLLLTFLLDTRNSEGYNSYIAKGRLRHLITLLREHPELLSTVDLLDELQKYTKRS